MLLLLIACNSYKGVSGYYSYEVECIGNQMDGVQVLKAWGSGSSMKMAIEAAKKEAIDALLFKGIRKGKSVCSMKPIIVKVNAKEVYADYFESFYGKRGLYKKFVKTTKQGFLKKSSTSSNDGNVSYSVTVYVDIKKLKRQLINDNILQ